MPIYTKEEQFKLVEKDSYGANLKKIDNQYEEVCIKSVKQNGLNLQYVKHQTPKICLEAVRQTGYAIQYVKEQTRELCLEAVKNTGNALHEIKDRTHEICLEAVKKNGMALQFVKDQTDNICLEAVRQNWFALKYVKFQTKDICLEALKQDTSAFDFVKQKSDELCFLVYLYNHNTRIHIFIQDFLRRIKEKKDFIKNNIFCTNKYNNINEHFNYFDTDSLIYLKDFLLKQNSNNIYIFNDEYFKNEEYLTLLKELALSNNKVVLVDTGNIKEIHKILANRIIKVEDLYKESF